MGYPVSGEADNGDHDVQFVDDIASDDSGLDSGSVGVVVDMITGLMWTDSSALVPMQYWDALAYCDELIAGGHDDWKLPSLEEYKRISRCEAILRCDDSLIHTDMCAGCIGYNQNMWRIEVGGFNGQYWVRSSSNQAEMGGAIAIDSLTSKATYVTILYDHYVLCVRKEFTPF